MYLIYLNLFGFLMLIRSICSFHSISRFSRKRNRVGIHEETQNLVANKTVSNNGGGLHVQISITGSISNSLKSESLNRDIIKTPMEPINPYTSEVISLLTENANDSLERHNSIIKIESVPSNSLQLDKFVKTLGNAIDERSYIMLSPWNPASSLTRSLAIAEVLLVLIVVLYMAIRRRQSQYLSLSNHLALTRKNLKMMSIQSLDIEKSTVSTKIHGSLSTIPESDEKSSQSISEVEEGKRSIYDSNISSMAQSLDQCHMIIEDLLAHAIRQNNIDEEYCIFQKETATLHSPNVPIIPAVRELIMESYLTPSSNTKFLASPALSNLNIKACVCSVMGNSVRVFEGHLLSSQSSTKITARESTTNPAYKLTQFIDEAFLKHVPINLTSIITPRTVSTPRENIIQDISYILYLKSVDGSQEWNELVIRLTDLENCERGGISPLVSLETKESSLLMEQLGSSNIPTALIDMRALTFIVRGRGRLTLVLETSDARDTLLLSIQEQLRLLRLTSNANETVARDRKLLECRRQLVQVEEQNKVLTERCSHLETQLIKTSEQYETTMAETQERLKFAEQQTLEAEGNRQAFQKAVAEAQAELKSTNDTIDNLLIQLNEESKLTMQALADAERQQQVLTEQYQSVLTELQQQKALISSSSDSSVAPLDDLNLISELRHELTARRAEYTSLLTAHEDLKKEYEEAQNRLQEAGDALFSSQPQPLALEIESKNEGKKENKSEYIHNDDDDDDRNDTDNITVASEILHKLSIELYELQSLNKPSIKNETGNLNQIQQFITYSPHAPISPHPPRSQDVENGSVRRRRGSGSTFMSVLTPASEELTPLATSSIVSRRSKGRSMTTSPAKKERSLLKVHSEDDYDEWPPRRAPIRHASKTQTKSSSRIPTTPKTISFRPSKLLRPAEL